jgi:hypothetical protein
VQQSPVHGHVVSMKQLQHVHLKAIHRTVLIKTIIGIISTMQYIIAAYALNMLGKELKLNNPLSYAGRLANVAFNVVNISVATPHQTYAPSHVLLVSCAKKVSNVILLANCIYSGTLVFFILVNAVFS